MRYRLDKFSQPEMKIMRMESGEKSLYFMHPPLDPIHYNHSIPNNLRHAVFKANSVYQYKCLIIHGRVKQ